MAKLRRNREYILSVTPPFPRNMLLEVSIFVIMIVYSADITT